MHDALAGWLKVDVFDGLRNLSVVEHREGNPVEVVTGTDTFNLRPGDCLLLPPDRPSTSCLESVAATVTT